MLKLIGRHKIERTHYEKEHSSTLRRNPDCRFASPSKSEEQFFGFGVEISKRSELVVSIAILIVEANKPMEGK